MRTRVYAAYVPKERQEKIDRFIFPRDMRLSLYNKSSIQW